MYQYACYDSHTHYKIRHLKMNWLSEAPAWYYLIIIPLILIAIYKIGLLNKTRKIRKAEFRQMLMDSMVRRKEYQKLDDKYKARLDAKYAAQDVANEDTTEY